jgi:hypothetical protein
VKDEKTVVIYFLLFQYQVKIGNSSEIIVYRWEIMNKYFLTKQVYKQQITALLRLVTERPTPPLVEVKASF